MGKDGHCRRAYGALTVLPAAPAANSPNSRPSARLSKTSQTKATTSTKAPSAKLAFFCMIRVSPPVETTVWHASPSRSIDVQFGPLQMSEMGSIAKRQKFFTIRAKLACGFRDRESATLMTALGGWRSGGFLCTIASCCQPSRTARSALQPQPPLPEAGLPAAVRVFRAASALACACRMHSRSWRMLCGRLPTTGFCIPSAPRAECASPRCVALWPIQDQREQLPL